MIKTKHHYKLSIVWTTVKLKVIEQFYVLYFKCETLNVID